MPKKEPSAARGLLEGAASPKFDLVKSHCGFKEKIGIDGHVDKVLAALEELRA